MAVAPESISRVENVADVGALPAFEEPVALLAQTTLSHRDWGDVAVAVRDRFPDVWTPGRSDLCFATTNRQSSLLAVADRCDAMIVIGSANSSNTMALERLARESRSKRVARINTADEIPDEVLAGRGRRRHRGRIGTRRDRGRGDRPTRSATAWSSSASRTRTSTSRRRATCASCNRRSASPRPACSAAHSTAARRWTIGRSARATSSPPSPAPELWPALIAGRA